MTDFRKNVLRLHSENHGKIEICSKTHVKSRDDLSMLYTPGVAEVSREIVKNPDLAYKYTIKSNTVAIVTDGSAVLGLGNIGGYAAIPVMEGKAVLFKEFAGIDAFPIVFENYHTDFIEDVRNIAPIFGAINLEDIAAPKCFELEDKLQGIGIPVMHDDQWGTAVVVLAALINAVKIVGKDWNSLRITICGAGAAGTAISRMIREYNKRCDIIVCDSLGIIYRGRNKLNRYKRKLTGITNARSIRGDLSNAMIGSDIFIGVSKAGLVDGKMVESMNHDAIVFAMANPDPEIMPLTAKRAGARIVGTGRSDFPNQINNVLAFPGIFRGALDSCATTINMEMKLSAARALAESVKPKEYNIVPDPLDYKVPHIIAKAVKTAAKKTNCARNL